MVTFSPDVDRVTFTVQTVKDDVYNVNCRIFADIAAVNVNYRGGSDPWARVAVKEDEPRVSIKASHSSVTEGDSIVYTVTGEPAPASETAVRLNWYRMLNFTTSPPTSMTCNADDASVSFTIQTVNDNTRSKDRSVPGEVVSKLGIDTYGSGEHS